MILKKPYAFLIKYFKLIHLIVTVPMIYLAYKSYNLVEFFSESIENNYISVLSGEVAGIFINYFMYLSVIIVLIALVAIYYLLSHKDKPRKFYMYAIIYYVVLLVLFPIFYSFITAFTSETIESTSLRAYRDISLIAALPQIFFIIYTFVSAIGFNIKKFNFGEDLKELQIQEEDNEEFEFIVGQNSYKTKRSIRKFIREFIYYIKENSFIFTIILVIVLTIFGTGLFLNREVYNKKYKMSEGITHNTFNIKIEDSIVTNLSFRGEEINKNKYYIAVKLTVTNNNYTHEKLDYTNFRIVIGKREAKPTLDKSLYFKDYGSPYYGDNITKNSSKTIVLVYEITKEEIKDNYLLKIFKGIANTPGEIIAKYSEIKLTPLLINEIGDANSVLLNEELEFIYSNVGNTTLLVSSFQFTKSFLYSYEKCEKDKCRTLDDIISIDYAESNDYRMLLILDYEFKLDRDTSYGKYNISLKNFIENFMKIKYVKNGKEYYSKVIYKTPSNLKDKLALQVKSDVNEAESVSLIFTVRNKNYIIELK